MNLDHLTTPFPEDCLEWRVQRTGLNRHGNIYAGIVPYLSGAAVKDRLDTVCGFGGWQNQFRPGPCGGIMCGIGIKIGDEWVWKWDGAENTDVEAVKGGFTDALKRAAVQWGIGRYLHKMSKVYAIVSDERPEHPNEWNFANHKERDKPDRAFWWRPPVLSPDFLPAKQPENGRVNGAGRYTGVTR